MKMKTQLTLTISEVEAMVCEELEELLTPTTLYLGVEPYQFLSKALSGMARFSSAPPSGGVSLTNIVTSGGDIRVVAVPPGEYGNDLVLLTDDPKDLERYPAYKINKEMDRVILEALGVDEDTIYR